MRIKGSKASLKPIKPQIQILCTQKWDVSSTGLEWPPSMTLLAVAHLVLLCGFSCQLIQQKFHFSGISNSLGCWYDFDLFPTATGTAASEKLRLLSQLLRHLGENSRGTTTRTIFTPTYEKQNKTKINQTKSIKQMFSNFGRSSCRSWDSSAVSVASECLKQ